jgi:hypothetical protein
MIKIFYFFIFLAVSFTVPAQARTDASQRDQAFYNATAKWFTAWELVSKEIFKIDKVRPVEFVFFDDTYVYSTSCTTIKEGVAVKGMGLMNLSFNWKRTKHRDSLTLPDKTVVPIQLMSFAAQIPFEIEKSFFVMPLPGYWEQSGTTSKELGLENLITGVFIHEFSHSQQMQNFGRKISEYEQQNNFGLEFSDDIVQHIFGKDSSYITQYQKEVEVFYASTKAKRLDKKCVNEGLKVMRQRQQTFFEGTHKNLAEIDNFFLTMEGLGQYAMYLWLTHRRGGNMTRDVAIEGVRRKKKWWSQDEGFALFLILDKLTSPVTWAKDMFGSRTENVTTLIERLSK